MNSNTESKEPNLLLNNKANYKEELDANIELIITKYSELIIEYYKFISENLKLKNANYVKFIVVRGLDTITNVFYNLLLYTKNIDVTYFHCQKAYYFYVEFVCQISEDEKKFLQLSSRDASTYVYKKTIFDIPIELKKQHSEHNSSEKIHIINTYINIYKTYIHKIINTSPNKIESNKIESNKIEQTQSVLKFIYAFKKISDKLNIHILKKEHIAILDKITDTLYFHVDDCQLFIDLNELIIKKLLKSPDILFKCETKINHEDFITMINNINTNTTNDFLLWLTN